MRIAIRHTTSYRYDRPVDFGTQLVRAYPLNHGGQRVLAWRIRDADGRRLARVEDGYGNVVHFLTINRPHDSVSVTAEGEVADRVERLHQLMTAIGGRIAHTGGASAIATTAAEALARSNGACQDLAHVFLVASRCLGHPARYVSGYLWEGGRTEPGEAMHGWAEAYVDGLGWVGFDPVNGLSPTDAYVRVAIGLDYREAMPVLGVRRGAVKEALAVEVEVQQVQAQQ
ncbi:MAG: transglutaminase family protein [Proteobacteria bacterium]|nr:transglutaminase family protein [Pseudomonadota bacterium]